MKIDLREKFFFQKNQLNLGSCTSISITYIIEYYEYLQKKKINELSSLFLYYNARKITNKIKNDTGLQFKLGCESVNRYGCCSEKLQPYNVNKLYVKPPDICYKDASQRRIKIVCSEIINNDEILLQLKHNNPLLVGFNVYKSYKTEYTIKTGYILDPIPDDEFCNYHAVVMVGFENDYFIIKNTYGKNQGLDGYGFIHKSLIDSNNLNFSFFNINYLNN